MARASIAQIALSLLTGFLLIVCFTILQMSHEKALAGVARPVAALAGPLFSTLPGCQCRADRKVEEDFQACFRCIERTAIAIQKSMLEEFGNFDVDFTSTITHHGTPLILQANASSVAGFDRQVTLSSEDHEICFNVYYSQNETGVRSLTHYNSSACGKKAGAHAFVLSLDEGFSIKEKTTSHLFQMTKEGQEFDLSKEDSDALYLKSIQEGGHNQSWAYRLGRGEPWRYFLVEQAGLQFFGREQYSKAAFRSTASSLSCLKEGSPIDSKTCQSFYPSEFPIPEITQLAHKTFPHWKSVTPERTIEAHFQDRSPSTNGQ